MSARRAVWEVARRELVERSRSRALRVSLLLLLILSVGGVVAAARLTGSTPTDDVGLVGTRSVALEPAIRLQAEAAGRRVHLHPLASATAASRALRGGSIDVVLLNRSRILVKTSRSQPGVRVVQDAIAAQGVFDRDRRGVHPHSHHEHAGGQRSGSRLVSPLTRVYALRRKQGERQSVEATCSSPAAERRLIEGAHLLGDQAVAASRTRRTGCCDNTTRARRRYARQRE